MPAFVAKFDPNGALVYSTFLGGGGYVTEARAVAVDSTGHAYVTGQTQREDFPTTLGALQTSCAVGTSWGCADAFVTKLNPDGASLAYSTYLGGPGSTASGDYGYEWGNGIAIDSQDNAYVTGLTRSNAFPVTTNAFQNTHGGGWADVFIAKLNASGSGLVYATYLGGAGGSLHGDEPYAIAVDGQGQAYVTGLTTSADFPTTAGAFQPNWSGYTNGFISKLNPDGSALVYSTYLGGPGAGRMYARGIAVDVAGNAYVTGSADDGFFTTPGAFQPQCFTAPALCTDAFVLKLNPSGSAPVWSTYLGGSGGELGNSIALDSQGHVYVAGSTLSTDFPTRFPVQGTYAGGDNSWHGDYYGGDVALTKLSSDGSRVLYSTYLGGSGADAGLGIAVDQTGNAYVTGLTASTDFPTVSPVQSSKYGSWDAIVFKLDAVTHDLTLAKTGTGTGTVTSEPSGISCGSTCGVAFDEGERVTLTHSASPGSTFTGWSGDCTGTASCVVDMDRARSVTATFTVPPRVSLAASPGSPQLRGTPILLTATASGVTSPTYRFWVTSGSGWSEVRGWGGNTYTWTPGSAGSYTLGVWVKSSATPGADVWAAVGTLPFTVSALSVSLAASPGSPQTVGTAIALTATVSGGAAPQQCKWLLTTNNWQSYSTLQDWGSCGYAWTPTTPASYKVGVWARRAGSTTNTAEASAGLPYTVTPMTVSLSANPPSPKPIDTAITLTATVSGGAAPQQCKWLLTTNNWQSYSTLQDWGACGYAWTPTTPGSYKVGVWARRAGSTTNTAEASAGLPYTVTPMTVSLSANPPSPQIPRTAITLTATVSGGAAPQQCKWLASTNNWQSYSVLQDWGACGYAWTPTTPGSYKVGVWARRNGTSADTPEASAGLPYTVSPIPVTLTANRPSSQILGSGATTLTASPSGGIAPYQCKWLLTTNNWQTYSPLQNWGSCSVSWTPAASGSYKVGVWARSSGNSADAAEGFAGLAFEIVLSVQGTYSVSGTATNSGCTDPSDNGSMGLTGTLQLWQTGGTFSGTLTILAQEITTLNLNGTVSVTGQVSGSFGNAEGSYTFSGNSGGPTLSLTFAGAWQDDVGRCNLSGSLTATR